MLLESLRSFSATELTPLGTEQAEVGDFGTVGSGIAAAHAPRFIHACVEYMNMLGESSYWVNVVIAV